MYCQNDRDQKDKVRPGENLFMARQAGQTILAPESVGNSVECRLCGLCAQCAQCPVPSAAPAPAKCLLRRLFCEARRRDEENDTIDRNGEYERTPVPTNLDQIRLSRARTIPIAV